MGLPPARPVGPGARLAAVAPSGPFDRDAFEAGVAWLRERYEVVFDDRIFTRHGYLAGSDERRLAELAAAIEDPAVDAILCARGGFGATRLLPRLSVAAIREANKLIVGFSDATALHATWARAGVRSLHAPMIAALGRAPDSIRRLWIATLEGESTPLSRQLTIVSGGTRPGRLFGGNLAVLHSLLGTPYAPPLDDVILVLEDVGERPYRIDRMLTSLRQAGWFDRVAGVVLGAFTEGQPGPDGVAVEEVLRSHFAGSPFPVVEGLEAGHIDDNLPLPFGAAATIDGALFEVSPTG